MEDSRAAMAESPRVVGDAPRPVSVLISALGGQGGGVLTEWIVAAAADAGDDLERITRARRAKAVLVNPVGFGEDPAARRTRPGQPLPRGTDATTAQTIPAYARAIDTRAPVAIDDTATSDLLPRDWVETYSHRSYLVTPLIRQDQVFGVMNLDYTERATAFQPWQVDLARAIAGQLALSLENSRLYVEAQQRLHETSALVSVGRALSRRQGRTYASMARLPLDDNGGSES